MKKITNRILVFATLLATFFTAEAQDGAKLFKQNCAACHKVDKNSVGPMLKGAKAKWEEAGEGDLIYEWVKNPSELYESGKSKRAKEVWDFSPATMSPMGHLSKEEIDAIFKYVDAPQKPKEEPKADENTENETVVPQSTSTDVTGGTFFFLICMIVFLVVALLVLANAISALKHKDDKDKIKYDNEGLGFLTNAVSIEDEDAILLDHDYDGIKELDNVLPPWWVWMFYGTIIFAFVYWGAYQTFKIWPLQDEAYAQQMAESEKEVYNYKKENGLLISADNVTFLTDKEDLAKGKELYDGTCMVCHMADGEGSVGPNLTDKYWIYGGTPGDMFTTVSKGRPNGMPAHESKFNEKQIQQIISYVHSLPFKEGKAPQGELMK